MRVFVTGATGFVGSHVVDTLLERGHEPICLVRRTSVTGHLDACGVRKAEGSLADPEALTEVLAEVDAVIHIAGVIKVRAVEEFYSVNGHASRQLAEVAARVNPGLRRYVHVSSVAAQGPSPGSGPRDLALEPGPVSHYGKSKLEGERGALAMASSMPVTVVRPPAVYGPRDPEMFQAFKLASLGLAPVYGQGMGLLSVVHVFDLADAIVRCVEEGHPTGSVFTVDDGRSYTWREFTAGVGQALGKKPLTLPLPSLAFDVAARIGESLGQLTGKAMILTRDKVKEMRQPSWVCGHEAISGAIGWKPQWPLERGAPQAAAWYREAGWI